MKIRFGLFLLAAGLVIASACQPVAPRIIATPVGGPSATVGPVNMPLSYTPLNNFTTPVCRIYVEFKVNGDELVVVPEGNLLVNSPIAGPGGGPSGTCFIGNAHFPADGNQYHKAVEIDCGPTPIPAGQHLGDLRISSFEDSDAGTYPVTLLNAVSYRCDGTPTSAGTRVTGADITLF